jgi:hypothetical protein
MPDQKTYLKKRKMRVAFVRHPSGNLGDERITPCACTIETKMPC